MEPLILVTNDDSIKSRGIRVLAEVAKQFGQVWVIAPDSVWSAKSHAVTLESPLYYRRYDDFGVDGVEAVAVSGTPADSVKLALHEILPREPDFIFSGINHGSNYSINLFYSGTVAAIVEGAFHGIPSVAFSLDSHDPMADLSLAAEHTKAIIESFVALEDKADMCLNVNIPNIDKQNSKGIKYCRQARGKWIEEFVERTHPSSGQKYYWLTGKFINFEPESQETDVWAVENGYTSVVPLQTDLTNYQILEKLKK